MALLDDVKLACRVASDSYDTEITDLINAGLADMGITDIQAALLVSVDTLPLIKRAVITYCKMNFGYVAEDVYKRLKDSYDEQKAQLLMSSEYSEWGGSNA